MSKVSLKKIDFNDSKAASVDFDLKNTKFESPESVAYVLNWQLARRRSGSASIKTMHEISGTTAKPHKQKGTGHARAGSKRSVQFRGGRACFGPRPRSFDYSLPKKIIQKALSDVLRLKIKEKKVVLLGNAYKKDLKSSEVNKILQDSKIQKALFLYDGSDENAKYLVRSTKNVKNVKSLDVVALNVYDIVKYDSIILDEKLLETIKKTIS